RLAAVPPPAPPAPVRLYECRREWRGLLWFVTMAIREEDGRVVRVSSGLPHCPKCVVALKLAMIPREEWACPSCGRRRPGHDASLPSTDALLTECLQELFARHPDFSPAEGLSAPRYRPPRRTAAPGPRLAGRLARHARRRLKRVF
ncbi:MAG: hypothetical protein KGM24_05910, partial [Elusimicrobia bacterium]|nr:hypothetical protein [Elusimicrobiota bacterium]